MTSINSSDYIDLIFTRAFFYNFRLFTTPTVFVELLVKRFSLQPPPELNEEELALWTEKVLVPVRLRVYNVTKTWLESYFCYEQDASTEKQLIDFATGPMAQAMPAPAKRLTELIRKRVSILLSTIQVSSLVNNSMMHSSLQRD